VTEEQPDPEAEAVRRLLAEARHSEPMPADVAARMDAVLADLSSAADDPAPAVPEQTPGVVSLAGHRRRRAAGLLVAAAAIVVGGVTVAQHLPSRGSGSQGASAASGQDSSAEFDRGSGSTPAPRASSTAPAPQDLAGSAATVRRGRVVVRPQHFTADALAARRLVTAASPGRSTRNLARIPSRCVDAPGDSTVVRATYQRAPAALVFHRPVSSSQVVDLFVCGSPRPVRSATLPQP
jgi:hypothetical protein